MQENNSENNTNKTPHKMARLAWPKAKYGAILAIIIIIISFILFYLLPSFEGSSFVRVNKYYSTFIRTFVRNKIPSNEGTIEE